MFQPVIPADGLVGWRFLQRTYDNQIGAFSSSPQLKLDTDYFKENIASIETAEQLVQDRRLLTVALGAFGLQDDINNRFFVQKMLEEGTTNSDAFANRFADARYQEFSEAFGLGPGEVKFYKLPGVIDKMVQDYERQSFEIAVGTQSETLRIAMTAERSFQKLATSTSSEAGKWFTVMGQPPMRSLFETVFQLPTAFAQIDIDQQQEILAERSFRAFGTSDPADFNEESLRERLLTRYTAISQANAVNTSTIGGTIALTLLRSG